jgi:hypothetical protein
VYALEEEMPTDLTPRRTRMKPVPKPILPLLALILLGGAASAEDRPAALFIEHATRKPGPVQAGTAEVGVGGEHVFEQRLAVLNLLAELPLGICSPFSKFLF